MASPKKLYLSEFAVNLFTSRWLMIPVSQLMSGGSMGAEEQEVANNSHIYLICKRPILSFSKHSFCYEDGNVSGHINYRIEGEVSELEFSIPFPLLDGATEVGLSKYPHREFSTFNDSGEEVRYMPASAVAMGLGLHYKREELSNLEVLYVGQAFGDGSRSAFDRLKSHSTLQKILAQAQYEDPDSEVFVLTFEYMPYRVLSHMDPRAQDAIKDHRDIDRFRSIMNNPLTEHQQICLAEAGLIRYFQPKFNAIYKDNFPNANHKILESCYDLDFSALVVEINTDELGFNLYSDAVKPNDHHMSKVDILDPVQRWGFFHHSRGDGTTFQMPNVIARRSKG
ncbi:hypothetical protein [Vibrio parahaemolyticus]|uniref:hypothetical protein n=1 Tax=Vibrio parahaemolyticus TaxID=670 RepID=UPI00040EBECC|nr:hypothetical protein [Vibrio parahaemolyticus]